jgi:hypothetical protein
MKRWFNEKVFMYIALVLLLVSGVLSAINGFDNRRAISEARDERAEYLESSRELMAGLRDAEDLVQESLVELGKIKSLHDELREQVEGIGTVTQDVGDDSVGIGIESDENLRIIRELRKRFRESEEK